MEEIKKLSIPKSYGTPLRLLIVGAMSPLDYMVIMPSINHMKRLSKRDCRKRYN